MGELDGALEALAGLQNLAASLQGEDDGDFASVAGAAQVKSPPRSEQSESVASEPSPGAVEGEPDEPSTENDEEDTEEDGEIDERQKVLEQMKGASKGRGRGGGIITCPKPKAAACASRLPRSAIDEAPWKKPRVAKPSSCEPASSSSERSFAGGAYVVGANADLRPVPPGFPPPMREHVPPPPPGYVEPLPYASTAPQVRIPPPPPPAVRPGQQVVRPSSKRQADNKPPGGSRRNWELQYRIAMKNGEEARLAFVRRWPRPSNRDEDVIFWEKFRAAMPRPPNPYGGDK